LRKGIRERTKQIEKLLEEQKKYTDARNSVDVINKFGDLTDLLFDRERLYNQLYMLSGKYGKDLFDASMMMDMYKLGKKYTDNELEKVYKNFVETGKFDFGGFPIGHVAEYAKQKGDQQTADIIKFAGKIATAFDANSFDVQQNKDASAVFGDVL
jgi:hypothetical protein